MIAQLAISEASRAPDLRLLRSHPSRLRTLEALFRDAAIDPDAIDKAKAKFAASSTKKTPSQRAGRAVIIPVSGILVQRTDWLSELLGEVGTGGPRLHD